MALLLGSNAYTTLAAFKAWALLRNFDISSYTDEVIEAGVVVSSLDFIEPNYTFKGTKSDAAQLMSLPTDDVALLDVENPTCYTVLQYLQGQLFVDPSDLSLAEVTSQTDKLGELSTSTTFREGSTLTYKKPTQKIDRLFGPYITSSNTGLEIRRG